MSEPLAIFLVWLIGGFIGFMGACVMAARARKECEMDSARLDWMIDQGPPGAAKGAGLNDEAWEAAYAMDAISDDHQCVRDAIDCAMDEQ